MQCPRCQNPLRPGAHFCSNCGLTLSQTSPGSPASSPGASPGPPPPQGQAPPPPQFRPPAGAAPSYPPPPPQQQYGYGPPPPQPSVSPSPPQSGVSFLNLLPWIGVFFAGLVLGLVIGMVLSGAGKGDEATPTPVATKASIAPAVTEVPAPARTPAPDPTAIEPSPAQGAQVGQIAPDFVLKDLDEKEVRLNDYRGKVVVLVFWKTADIDSETMMPHLKRFHQEHKDDPDILLLTVNSGSPRDAVKPLADVSGWEFQILLDEDKRESGQYEITFWPTTFFLNREGTIQDRVSEVWTFDQLSERANSLK